MKNYNIDYVNWEAESMKDYTFFVILLTFLIAIFLGLIMVLYVGDYIWVK